MRQRRGLFTYGLNGVRNGWVPTWTALKSMAPFTFISWESSKLGSTLQWRCDVLLLLLPVLLLILILLWRFCWLVVVNAARWMHQVAACCWRETGCGCQWLMGKGGCGTAAAVVAEWQLDTEAWQAAASSWWDDCHHCLCLHVTWRDPKKRQLHWHWLISSCNRVPFMIDNVY